MRILKEFIFNVSEIGLINTLLRYYMNLIYALQHYRIAFLRLMFCRSRSCDGVTEWKPNYLDRKNTARKPVYAETDVPRVNSLTHSDRC